MPVCQVDFLEGAGLGSEDTIFVNKVFDVVDVDRSGMIDWPEFVQAMTAETKEGATISRLREVV